MITAFADRSFTFENEEEPRRCLISSRRRPSSESGSKTPGREKVGAVTKSQVQEIAEKKMKDLNCDTLEAAMRMIEGSARSMGIEVKE